MSIIGLAGKKNSGKTTTGMAIQGLSDKYSVDGITCIIQEAFEGEQISLDHEKWKIKSFAHKVKEVASILTGYPVKKFEDRKFKNSHLDLWQMTGRELLQKIGTDALRNGLDDQVWIKALFSDYKDDNWIITDVRFPNEAIAIQERGGIVVLLLRNIDSNDRHPSEREVENISPDYIIDNRNTTIYENILQVKKFLNDYNL
jgi:ABC-type oligopeptide transport system ATPase subunit